MLIIDDVLVASTSPEEHLRHFQLIFERLQHHGIIIYPQKCVFGASSIEFLGHRVDCHGIHPLPDKVQSILDFPQPTSRRQLRTFLGLINFYHRFLSSCAKILDPLNALLSGRSETLAWDDVTQQAFVTIKESLASATLLVHPKPNALTCVMADASDTAVGAVLQQYVGNRWQPVSFFSRMLKPAEKRYSAFDRELLAVYVAIEHFIFSRG